MGRSCASVSVDDDGEASHAFVATKSDGPRAELRTETHGASLPHAEMSLKGNPWGSRGSRTITVTQDGWPGTRDRGPDIRYCDDEVGDNYSLRTVCRDAQGHADEMRKKAEEARKAGDSPRARDSRRSKPRGMMHRTRLSSPCRSADGGREAYLTRQPFNGQRDDGTAFRGSFVASGTTSEV